LVAFVLALSVAGATAVQHYGVGLLLFGLLSITLRRVWLPSVFELGSKGVFRSRLGRRQRVPWTEFARYEVHRRGIMLFADLEPNSFSPWRAMFIRWPENRDELLSVVEFYLHGPLQTSLLSTRSLSQVSPPSANQ
jgi:hypothetical protein